MADPENFSYAVVKNGSVMVSHNGRHVVTVAGREAERLTARLAAADDDGVQLLLAKATRNFKRGNERVGRHASDRERRGA
jgi:hypothetical protein